MKANKAQKRIYLQVCGDCRQTDCENCKFEDLEDNVTWCKDKIFDKDIEYTRTDAFIKKARKYFIKELPNFRSFMESGTAFIKTFESFLQGE